MINGEKSRPTAEGGLRRLADEAGSIVWEMDSSGRFLYLDPQSARLVDLKSVRLGDWLKFIHPEDLPRARAAVKQAKEKCEKYSIEYRLVRSDGTLRWMHSTAAPRIANNGEPPGFIGTIVDVTMHHEAKEQLLRSEAEHRLITENAGDMVSYIDAQGNYAYVSPSHEEIFGYAPHELIGRPLFEFLHPEDLAQQQTSKRSGLLKLRARRKDGSWSWISANRRAIRDVKTGDYCGTVAVARDITHEIETERELILREERFRSLTKLSSDWYWELDSDGRFTFLSDGIATRLGLHPEELLGTPMAATWHDPTEKSVAEITESFAQRKPFKDLIIGVSLPAYPGIVRHVRISGEPFFLDGIYKGFRGATRDVTKEVKISLELRRLATRDLLTDLPNRGELNARLNERINDRRGSTPHGVFFIDLDRFKEINDSYGHKVGDGLLQEIVQRLQAVLRPDDVLARLGGDEFVLIAACRKGVASATRIAEKMLAALAQPVLVDRNEIFVRASIGISVHPDDGQTSEELLSGADTALYRAKSQGGNRYCFFTAEMRVAAIRRMTLQNDMRHAIERCEFELHYQPRVRAHNLEIAGMEALLRWRHPQLGWIPPIEFIPLAEETGFINALGVWVLRQAICQAKAWMTAHPKPLRVSVNVSAKQFYDRRFVSIVNDALTEHLFPAEALELELTESALMEDTQGAVAVMHELKSMGVRLSIDDFGTGYSSLAYLRKFPVDCLKLDASFLQLDDQQCVNPLILAKTVINLAHALNLTVVAEGVESIEHLHFLSQTSCDEIQGYAISRPVPPAAFGQLLGKPPQKE
jgi:diguanylate cyclase (GGDEF)-like protein/PAS domain S-box-containing protein